MTKRDFNKELCDELVGRGILTTREELLDYVKYCIDEDFLPTASHILEELSLSSADYFLTDYSTGCCSINDIRTKDDILSFCDIELF